MRLLSKHLCSEPCRGRTGGALLAAVTSGFSSTNGRCANNVPRIRCWLFYSLPAIWRGLGPPGMWSSLDVQLNTALYGLRSEREGTCSATSCSSYVAFIGLQYGSSWSLFLYVQASTRFAHSNVSARFDIHVTCISLEDFRSPNIDLHVLLAARWCFHNKVPLQRILISRIIYRQ